MRGFLLSQFHFTGSVARSECDAAARIATPAVCTNSLSIWQTFPVISSNRFAIRRGRTPTSAIRKGDGKQGAFAMEQASKKSRRLAPTFAHARKLLASFRSSKRGNVAIICALCALPLVSAMGCVVDYTMASTIKTKLQAASDAAALATVSINSSVISTATTMSGGGTVSNGATTAINYFNANLTTAPADTNYKNLTSSATVTKSGQTVTAALSFSASVPTFFMDILGYQSIAISGTSTASYSLPTFIDFYLMLDVSGSMSFPSTQAEQQRLMAVNPDDLLGNPGYQQGCQFACHFAAQGSCPQTGDPVHMGPIPAMGAAAPKNTNPSPGGYCQGFLISRLGTTPVSFGTPSSTNNNVENGNNINWSNTPVSNCPNPGTTSCIQLRADAVGYAVNALLSQAAQTESADGISNQFRVGLFPFIQNVCTSSAGSSNSCSVGLTTSLSGSTITTFAAQLANLLDTGQNATLGSGGTHFENALSGLNTFISNVGTGASSTNTLPYLFIVTDGSQDYQTQSGGNWGAENWSASTDVPYQNTSNVMPGFTGNDQSGTMNINWCTKIKKRGITIAILYIPYQPISDPSTIWDDEDGYANANVNSGNIPASLQSCASTNFFYTANSPADITNALVTMFEQAVSTAHITN
jgi:Flp pilus assembly protein TadG